jgi:hypothetical protein
VADFGRIIADLQQQVGYLQNAVRHLDGSQRQLKGDHERSRGEMELVSRNITQLSAALGAVEAVPNQRSAGSGAMNDHIRYIESLPGRRIPFTLGVDIPIGSAVTSVQQGTKTVSQDGPFVAVARVIAFQSAFQAVKTDPVTGAAATFFGRSNGRFRPPHSAWDLNDALASLYPGLVSPIAFPGTGAPAIASPTNASGFRTMEFDGFVEFLNQGAAYPRSNQEEPTTLWTNDISSPFQLGCLDFFERGETLQWKVRPTHENNPPFGNLAGYAAGGLFPFLGSQYDTQEGINDQLNPAATVDPVRRLPDGILFIGFHGFRVVQPPGPVRIT